MSDDFTGLLDELASQDPELAWGLAEMDAEMRLGFRLQEGQVYQCARLCCSRCGPWPPARGRYVAGFVEDYCPVCRQALYPVFEPAEEFEPGGAYAGLARWLRENDGHGLDH